MGWSSDIMHQRSQPPRLTPLMLQQRKDALRALRDCGVIRARWVRPGFHDLARDGYATAAKVEGRIGYYDYRLSEKGRDLAVAEL